MTPTTLTREQLEERLAGLHRASLELIQDTALESLLERIARIACEEAGAQYAAVGVLDDQGGLEKFIPIGMTEAEIKQMAHYPVGKGLIGVLMRGEGPVRVSNIADDPRSSGFPAHHPPMTSFLGVPIGAAGRQLGQIYLTNKIGADEFTPEDQQVIETLAAYAAIAISNVRLYRQLTQRDQVLTQRSENLALLNDLASTLASSSDIDQILDKALTQMMEYLHLELGEIFLREEDSKVLKLVLHRSEISGSLWVHKEFHIGEGMVGQVAKAGQPRLFDLPGSDGDGLEQSARDSCFRQIACFPLPGRSGVIGVLVIANCHPGPLNEQEIQLLSSIGSWVGMAVENVRLSLQQRRLAVLEERERIGMDLHDGIIQSIYAVGLTLDHARLLMAEDPEAARQRIVQATSDLNSTIRDIRTYILDLRPRQLYNESLMQGVQRLVSEFRANTLVDVNLQGPPDNLAGLPDAQAIALFHICQEALANIAKHGRARHVEVSLWKTSDRVLLEVSDDGRGFDPSKIRLTLGHGLANMQTRVHNVGGEVEISSEPGKGAAVLAWVPFSNEG
jgi:two-component system, NarL family, sensor histidine kinase DevS